MNELKAGCIYHSRTGGKQQKRVQFYFYAVSTQALRKVNDKEKKQFDFGFDKIDIIKKYEGRNTGRRRKYLIRRVLSGYENF